MEKLTASNIADVLNIAATLVAIFLVVPSWLEPLKGSQLAAVSLLAVILAAETYVLRISMRS